MWCEKDLRGNESWLWPQLEWSHSFYPGWAALVLDTPLSAHCSPTLDQLTTRKWAGHHIALFWPHLLSHMGVAPVMSCTGSSSNVWSIEMSVAALTQDWMSEVRILWCVSFIRKPLSMNTILKMVLMVIQYEWLSHRGQVKSFFPFIGPEVCNQTNHLLVDIRMQIWDTYASPSLFRQKLRPSLLLSLLLPQMVILFLNCLPKRKEMTDTSFGSEADLEVPQKHFVFNGQQPSQLVSQWVCSCRGVSTWSWRCSEKADITSTTTWWCYSSNVNLLCCGSEP